MALMWPASRLETERPVPTWLATRASSGASRPVFGSYTRDPLCQAVEAAWNASIVVVVAAGNQGRNNNGSVGGYSTIMAPGNDPYVITVGAMKAEDSPDRADGSDRLRPYREAGPRGPGNQVRSILNSTSGMLYQQYPSTQTLVDYYSTGYSYK